MAVKALTDTDAIGRFLRKQPVENAYPLGYLDESYRAYTRWYGSVENDAVTAVITVYNGLSRPAMFTSGDPTGLEQTLQRFGAELPERVSGYITAEHLDSVEDVLRPSGELRGMRRMGLPRREFDHAADGTDARIEQLSHRDTAAIMQVYAHWPDHVFEPAQLDTGLYFGLRAGDGSLASIAGIHNVSERYDIAAIGNLVTHPAHRGNGYAKACTARLLDEAFRRVSLATLDVQEDNEPALRTYRYFGFEPFMTFYQGEFVRR